PEQIDVPGALTVDGKPVVWEACHTFSGSWGYHRDEASWKSVDVLVKMLIDIVSKNGNLLLNVGPTARGEFDSRATERLTGIGEWMKRHSRSIYGCTQAPDEFKPPKDCRLTYNPETNRLYIHIFSWPYRFLQVDFGERIEYAQLLNDASEIPVQKIRYPYFRNRNQDEEISMTTLLLPVQKPDVCVPVIEVFLKK
ncbi:MAG: alpha-L-fucosidase, partial [Candidatus Omnitrophica bacterium]|nr:alpha-L-fucosidase [Candidatus Omnitrophota bacterium]